MSAFLLMKVDNRVGMLGSEATHSLVVDMTSQGQVTIRELDGRVNGGIHVRLVWCEHDGRVLVTVYDAQTRRHHCIEVPEGERALQVFHHPYAYVSDAAPPNRLAECAPAAV